MIGRTLGHYRIVAPLGEGNMGVVFRARDLRLERDVALKILPDGSRTDATLRERFRREALSLSRLQHPNIAVIHDFDREGDVEYIVMELIEGETLAHRLTRGALVPSEARDVARQLALGLVGAHAHGLIHRDIKPGNIAISSDGQVKILDFGLARLAWTEAELPAADTALTAHGSVLGTPAYMAPEQLRGSAVDERADLWALGAVLFESLSGGRPFQGENSFVLAHEILDRPAPKLSSVRAGIPEDLERLVADCLAKDPADRPASASQVLRRLMASSHGSAAEAAPAARVALASTAQAGTGRRFSVLAMAIPIAAIVLVGLLFLAVKLATRQETAGVPSLAVLPLENLSRDPDQDFFCAGMTEELTTTIARVSGIHVVSRNSVLEVMRDRKSVAEIAKRLRVGVVLTGSVRRAGDRARISVMLVDARNERTLWADSFEAQLADVLDMQARVARAVAEHVRVQLTEQEQQALSRPRTVVPAAHEAYLRGRYAWNRYDAAGFHEAIQAYEAALKIDPLYAPAHAGLAQAYAGVSSLYLPAREAMPRAKAATRRALELDPGSAEAMATLAYVQAFFDWDWAAADSSFERAKALAPGEVTAHWAHGYSLMVRGRYADAERELDRSLEIDPLSAFIQVLRMMNVYHQRHYDLAEQGLRRVVEDFPEGSALAECFLGQTLLMKGELDSARVHLDRGARLDPANGGLLALKAVVEGRAGRTAEARRLLTSLEDLRRRVYVQPYMIAEVHHELGDRAATFEWLDLGIEERGEQSVFMAVDPLFDDLRPDPDYQRILGVLGLAGATRAPGVP